MPSHQLYWKMHLEIYSKARNTLDLFKGKTEQSPELSPEYKRIADWCSSVGALQQGPSSLDEHLLENSALKGAILQILDTLVDVLHSGELIKSWLNAFEIETSSTLRYHHPW